MGNQLIKPLESTIQKDAAVLACLSPAQRAALRHVEAVVRANQPAALRLLAAILSRTDSKIDDYNEAMEYIALHARVVVHFHPDRFGIKSMTVAEALLNEGSYRNQFEAGLSSGSPSAFPGGVRDTWENTLFGGAYHTNGVTDFERPKYGALELIRYSDGPIPRFGSCYLVMRPRVSTRTSFTFMGSEDPLAIERLGIMGLMDCVMAALLAEIEDGGVATPTWPPYRTPTLGVPHLSVSRFLKRMRELARPRTDPSDSNPGRVLDSGVEAQVHGPINLFEDVELLVADPSFKPTATGTILRELSLKYKIPLRWHCGFRLRVLGVPDNFRGSSMPRLARHIAGNNGTLDAARIGAAASSLQKQPEAWRDWGTPGEALQQLKQLWHILVHYGSPACSRVPDP